VKQEKSLADMRHVAESTARLAGALLVARLGQPRTIENKGRIDLVTDADPAAEALIKDRIRAHDPNALFLAEESGGASVGDSHGASLWIVDPLDGTTNYASGIPHYGVSIARMVAGEIQVGVIFDPSRDELFSAARGQGTTLNGRAIRVRDEADLSQAVVASGFPYDRAVREDNNTVEVRAVVPGIRGFRRNGAAALDMAWVAAGRFDAYWEQGIEAWDMAAGALLVEEAGGKMTALDGSPLDLAGRNGLASNGQVHDALVAQIQGARREAGFGPLPSFK
jgi:myo-inositol-1(or 4)-monophosphatase